MTTISCNGNPIGRKCQKKELSSGSSDWNIGMIRPSHTHCPLVPSFCFMFWKTHHLLSLINLAYMFFCFRTHLLHKDASNSFFAIELRKTFQRWYMSSNPCNRNKVDRKVRNLHNRLSRLNIFADFMLFSLQGNPERSRLFRHSVFFRT